MPTVDAEDAIEAVAYAQLNVPAVNALGERVPARPRGHAAAGGDHRRHGQRRELHDKDGNDELINLTITAVIAARSGGRCARSSGMVKQTLNGLTLSKRRVAAAVHVHRLGRLHAASESPTTRKATSRISASACSR
jgi:hypothetical protein